jgi:hypothetical protein
VGVYYRSDVARLTFRELWRITRNWPAFFNGCFVKAFGLSAPARWAVQHELAVRVLRAEELPEIALHALQPHIQQFQHSGSQFLFYYSNPTVGKLEGYAAALISRDCNALITVVWVRAEISERGTQRLSCNITSKLQDGTFFTTSNNPPTFNLPPEFKVRRLRSASPAELVQEHQDALMVRSLLPIPIYDECQVKDMLIDIKRRRFEWQVSRGVYVLLKEEERAQLGIATTDNTDR